MLIFYQSIILNGRGDVQPLRPLKIPIIIFTARAQEEDRKLGEELGQTVVIDNRGGAGATLGTGLAARAPADGHTLIISHSGLAINETLYAKLSYDALKDFAAISLVGIAPAAVVVNNALPVKSMK